MQDAQFGENFVRISLCRRLFYLRIVTAFQLEKKMFERTLRFQKSGGKIKSVTNTSMLGDKLVKTFFLIWYSQKKFPVLSKFHAPLV